MNFIPLCIVSLLLFPASFPSSFRFNRGAKVRTFFIPANFSEEKIKIYFYVLYPPQLLFPLSLAVWECKGKTSFPPFPNFIFLLFYPLFSNSLLFSYFFSCLCPNFFFLCYLLGGLLYGRIGSGKGVLGPNFPDLRSTLLAKEGWLGCLCLRLGWGTFACGLPYFRVMNIGSTIAHQP